MADPTPEPTPPDPRLAGEWQLDAPPDDFAPEPEPTLPPPPAFTPPSPLPPPPAPAPPTPEQLVEAMLFVGGPPLSADAAAIAVRGLTADAFRAAIDALNRRYRAQRRPYAIEAKDGGYVLVLSPAFRGVRERVFGGPREARLTQPALDVLAVVAYRQPVGKAEVDAVRGTDSGAVLRQLVRLGLVAVRRRADADGKEVLYGTTPRFLHVMGLGGLDDLPRLGDTAPV